ncbi:unnamed protein product [Alopecurus aequalis]
MARSMPMTLLVEDVAAGCCVFVAGAVGGSVFYFVKGSPRSSSRGCRLAGGVQTAITNGPRVPRWAAWSGIFVTMATGLYDTCHVTEPMNLVVAGGATSALFSMHRGTGAAVRSALKGAAYTGIALAAIKGVVCILESRRSSG